MATIQTFPEIKTPPADRYPQEYDVITINGRSGTVLTIYGDHAGIEVEHDEDDDHPWRLVTYTWVEGRGWLNGAMLQLTQRIGSAEVYEATEEEVEAIYREVMRKCPNVMAGLAKR